MARVDKTESAIGVTRATWAADVPANQFNKVVAVGLDAQGRAVIGAGNSGIVGVAIPDRTNYRAGQRVDIFGNGSEVIMEAGEELTAGTAYYATPAGALAAVATGNTRVGFTVERDRLVVTL